MLIFTFMHLEEEQPSPTPRVADAQVPSGWEPEYEEVRVRLEIALRRLCPPWLVGDREDLVQVALMRVMDIARRRAQEGGEPRTFSASYLWRTAQSVLIDELRRRRRRGEVAIEDGGDANHPVSLRADPERQARGEELGREIWDCLGRLVRPRRLAVMLHLEGYSPAEAVPLLGWKSKQVYNLVHRGVRDLRQCLSDKGLGP